MGAHQKEMEAVHFNELKISFEELSAKNKQFVDVEIFVNPGVLTDNDKAFLRPLLAAADIMDSLFWQQASPDGKAMKKRLARARADTLNRVDEATARYLEINAGRFDRLDHMKTFYGEGDKPVGGTFYPEGATKEEIEAWLATRPEQREAFMSPYTVLTKGHNELRIVPYSDYYRGELKEAATLLRQAAKFADSESLRAFLEARALAFEDNVYAPSDGAWVDVADSRFEVTIGPYEVYEDGLFGYKAAFEAFITMNDPKMSAELSTVKAYLGELEAALPLDDAHRGYKRATASPLFVVDLIYSAGDTRAGVQTLAFNLPNDEDVREKKGSKKVMLRNVSDAKFDKILAPISKLVIADEQVASVQKKDYFWHTVLHEISHGMGPGKITLDGEQTTVSLALKELYPHVEEAKADILGMFNAIYLTEKGYFKEPDRLKTLMSTALAGFFRSVRFGIHEAHGKANMLIYSFLKEQGVYVYDAGTKRFHVDLDKAKAGVTALARELLKIEATGDYAAAKAFIAKYGEMPPEVREALDGLTAIPVDLRPVYATTHAILGPRGE